jgi:hypothetical protein
MSDIWLLVYDHIVRKQAAELRARALSMPPFDWDAYVAGGSGYGTLPVCDRHGVDTETCHLCADLRTRDSAWIERELGDVEYRVGKFQGIQIECGPNFAPPSPAYWDGPVHVESLGRDQ